MNSSWTSKMQRRAVALSSCGHARHPYPLRMEKVKFGVPLDQVCKPDIPSPLLVLILKLNKEGPYKKDVFRAPGHQANMKKLIHSLQCGRLVNIANYSVHTIASVIKKFLRKLPEGILGLEAENKLFHILNDCQLPPDVDFQREQVSKVLSGLPLCRQQLLVLLVGTFRNIALASAQQNTGMTSEALGVSVAPSVFHGCIAHGKQATLDDVLRFKAATRIMKFLIDQFGSGHLFTKECYLYYAKWTGNIRMDGRWISQTCLSTTSLAPLFFEAESPLHRSPLGHHLNKESNCQSMCILGESLSLDHAVRLSVSLEGRERLGNLSPPVSLGSLIDPGCASCHASRRHSPPEAKSLSLIPMVYERQVERMRTRSEWFLSPLTSGDTGETPGS